MSPSSPKNRLRGVARKAREVVASDGSPGAAAGDGPLASRLFDPWYYALQTGSGTAPHEALDHWVREGAAAGLLPNPFTDLRATGLPATDIVAAVLDGSARAFPSRPFLDDLGLVALAPEATEHPGGPVGFYLQHAHAGAPVPMVGGRTWQRFVHLRGQQAKAVPLVLASGILDLEHYSVQTGLRFVDEREAVWHFLEQGEAEGRSPSPLYERSWYRSRAGVRMPMTFLHLLRTGQVEGAAGPHFDGATYLARVPDAADHPGGPLGHFLAHADDSTPTVPAADSGVDPAPWGRVRGVLGELAREVAAQEALLRPEPTTRARWAVESAEPATTGTGSVAVVADSREWDHEVPAHLASVLGQQHGSWTLRVAVDADVEVADHLAALAADPRIVLVPTAGTSWAARAHDVLATADEEWTVFWQPQEEWSPALLGGLLGSAGPGLLVHSACVDRADDRFRAALGGPEALLWQEPRGLAGMLLPTQALREGALRDDSGWDVLLHHGLEPRFVPFVGVRGRGLGRRPLPAGHRSTVEHVRRSEAVIDWAATDRDLPGRVPGRVSVLVVVVDGDRHRARNTVRHVLERSEGDVEVVVVDNGSDPRVSSILAACFAADPRVGILRVPAAGHPAVAVHRALAASTGEVVVLLDHDTEVQPGWVGPLVDRLRAPEVLAVQPLLLTNGDAVRSAGWVSAGEHVVPVRLLAGHPVADVPEGVIAPDAVSSVCLAVRAGTLVAVRGLDAAFVDLADVDLGRRIAAAHGGRFETVAGSRVSHRMDTPDAPASEPDQLLLLDRWGGRLPAARTDEWQRAGFTVAAFEPLPGLPASRRRSMASPVLVRPRSTVVDGPGAGLPRLRWAVKTAAWGGARGDGWGDTYFADDLVRVLQAWGQEAFVDRRLAHERPGADHLDDVTVTLRGLWPAVAQPGATNVLWVISHPDEVTADEVRQGFDLVYAAGRTWAERMAAVSGREVRTLLQATDSSRFFAGGEEMPDLGTLFVGRTRKVMRPVVRDAIEVGADLTIFGNGWEEFIDPAHVAADHLPNDRVPAAYRGARIVLNDHWSDMARLGFYSNRLFDAVAAGARVVSDPVDGLEDVLGPSVRTYRTLDELRGLLEPGSTLWADDEVVAANAARVAAEHSFAARAKVLLADVLDARGVTHDVRDREG